jgi:hypothetical protein
MFAVGAEVGDDVVAGDDDRVFFQTPSLRLLAAGEELQARRLDDREVDLGLGRTRGRRSLLAAAAASREQEDD